MHTPFKEILKMNRSLFILSLVLMTVLAIGCSGGGTPTLPAADQDSVPPALTGSAQTEVPSDQPSQGHALMGLWECVWNPDEETVEFTPLRTADYHFNLVPILEGGVMNITLVDKPTVTDGVLSVNINFQHPFAAKPQLSGFDVKGIVITPGTHTGYSDPDLVLAGPGETRLLNADGFTRWWNPAEFTNAGLTGYNPGKLGAEIDPANAAILNGYKLHADGFGMNENMSELDPASRAFFEAGGVNARHYEISLVSGFVFNYAVDCSWAAPSPNPPVDIPGDFPMEANQAEPWFFEVTETLNSLWYEDGDWGGNLHYELVVHDWQGATDFGTLTFESPGVFSFTASEPDSATEFTASYSFNVDLPELESSNPLNVLCTMEVPGDYDSAFTGVTKPLRGYHRHLTLVADSDPIFNTPPVSIMEATSTTEIFTGEGVSFDGSDSYDPDGYITQYLWDFNGDGVYGDSYDGDPETPTHIYDEPGNFNAKLKVRDNSTGSAISQKVAIHVTLLTNDPPVAVAEATTATHIDEDNTVSFDGSASYDVDGTVVDWQWDFDGNGTYTDAYDGDMQTPTVTYADPGTYNVDLKVFDNESGWGVLETKIEIIVDDIPNVLPVADASATTPTEIDACGFVTFDGSASYDTDGTLQHYDWDFDGNGTYGDSYEEGNDINPTKYFMDEGVFNVDFMVTDDEGGEDTLDAPIVVTVTNILPTAVIIADTATEIYATESVTFNALDSVDPDCDDIVLYEWDFDNDSVFGDVYDEGTDTNPVKYFLEIGDFPVNLRVTDGQGGEDVTDAPIVITVLNHPPVSCAEITSSWPNMWETDLEFSGSCSYDPDGTIELYEWDLDADGSYEETGETVTYYFDTVGDYEIQLRVTDDQGETDLLFQPLSFHIYDDTNIPPTVNEVIHSRTTSQRSNSAEAVSLSVDFTDPIPPGDTHTYLWTCDYGTFDDETSPTPTWDPPGDIVQCDITVRVTDVLGAWDEGTCQQWVTQFAVITSNGNAVDGCMIIPGNLEDAVTEVMIDPASFKYPDETPNGNVVYINFWATWCGYCVSEMDELEIIYSMYEEEDYIHIHHNIGETKSQVLAFIASHPAFSATYWLLDQTSAYWNQTRPWNGGSGGIPQHLVFDRDGRCRGSRVGSINNYGIEPIDRFLRELI